MATRTYKILAFCASGIATSTLIAKSIEARLKEEGIDCVTDTCSGAALASRIPAFDMLITTADPAGFSNIPQGFPVVRAIPFITGIGEDECLEQIIAKLKSLDK